MGTEVDFKTGLRISTLLEVEFGIPVADMMSQSRRADLVEVRRILWLCLAMQGYGPAAIARYCGRDHSTIVHGLARARLDSVTRRRAAVLAAGELGASMPAPLRFLPAQDAAILLEYLRGMLGEVPLSIRAVIALRILSHSAEARAAVRTVLQLRGHADEYPRIQQHARNLGIPWDVHAAARGLAR
jgi:Bacterial dnaA protein helix-turn-helix